MAVQQWIESSTSRIAQGDVISAYSGLLVDINKCLHMRKSLETERTSTEIVMDAAARQRGNIPRLLELMGEWKKEVEKGSSLIMTLIRKINEAELVDMSDEKIGKFANNSMTPHVDNLKKMCSRFIEAIENLQDVGILKGKKESGFGALLSNFLSYFTDRNAKYAALQSLFESIDDPELMGTLEETHRAIEKMIKEIDEMTKTCETKAIENKTKRIKKLQLDYKIKQEESKTLERNSAKDAIRATKIFLNTEREELQDLASTEPDMSEDSRKRRARKAAIRNCKTFLTEGLRYSNDEADELINNIQD